MKSYITSTIFRKGLASLSGLFLVTFLLGHLAGNLQLFIPGVEGQTQFNKYALFMTTNPFVKILSIATYSSILLHIVLTLYLSIQSRRARPVRYAVSSGNENSRWSSRNMSLLGIVILFFLIVHLRSFWYEMHFGDIPYQELSDGEKITTVLQRIFMNLQRIFPNLQRIVLVARLKWLGSHRCFSVLANIRGTLRHPRVHLCTWRV